MVWTKKSGTILKRGHNVWQIRWEVRDPDGKRKRPARTIVGSYREADRELRRIRAATDNGLTPNNSKIMVAKYLDWWLQTYAVPNVRPRTSERYASDVRIHISPVIGGIRLDRLRAADAQVVLSKMLKAGSAARSVRHCYRVMRLALKHAVEKGILQVNVTDAVKPPRLESIELEIPSLEEVQHILNLAGNTPYHSVLSFMVRTGCRRGEALGLEWRHVDLENGTVSIVQSLQRIGTTGLRFVLPKSARSRRSIALDEHTVDLLRDHRGGHVLTMAQLGSTYEDNGLVFPGPLGKPLDPATLTRNFEKLALRAGKRHVRLHDLRHFHASMLLKAGIHLKVVQERLGHSSITITADTYSHVAPSLQREAAELFGKLAGMVNSPSSL